MKKTQYLLEQNALALRVDAEYGGRIVEFSLNGRNALTESAPEIGSTFWPSPQKAWHWPPPETLDKAPYVLVPSKKGLCLQSATCEMTNLQLDKAIEVNNGYASIVYRLTNQAKAPQRWAPWEISRIDGGLTFYQSNEPLLAQSNADVRYQGGVVWHSYDPSKQTEHEKAFGNGSTGWLANVCNGLLLVKTFTPIKNKALVAPTEAEIEIYAHGDAANPYIEIEQQGEYTLLAPGQTLTWAVNWYLAELPENIETQVGNSKLVDFVKKVIDIN